MTTVDPAGVGAAPPAAVDEVDETYDGHDTDGAARRMRWHGLQLVLLGLAGLSAAFALTADKFKLLADPSFRPSCDLNPVLSCGSVMVTEQAEVFGFPNSIIGLAAFGAVVAIGVVQLTGTRPSRVVQAGLAVGALAGWAFVHWLAFQSLYRIGALCPWCMVVWASTAPIAIWSVLRPLRDSGSGIGRLWTYRWSLLVAWYLLVVVLALVRFWTYWRTLL
ncbi:vitamin K epoxide reductase family protein [Nocardioides marmoraquaticus]